MAPPDQHLPVCRGHVELNYGPKENHSRAAIDVLFRSAAESYGPRVIGAVLSGTQSDGSLGLQAVAACGGVTLVQEPQEAAFAAMPRAALRATRVDHILPLAQIPALLADLAQAHDQTERSERMDDPPPPPPLQAARDAAVQRAVQGGISA